MPTLRRLIGSDRFDRALRQHGEKGSQSAPALDGLETMKQEPDNKGMTVEEGRDALKRAATRKFKLSSLDT